ncbi:hypothetical protein B0H14DRAFT_2563928 [Mycena olivaceomarginata]|nr:hypothetical protein B0H14DRAFT_2563928 [Mycena olivaceomarginata]
MPENPYKLMKSTRGSAVGALEFEGISALEPSAAEAKEVVSNAERLALLKSCRGNRLPVLGAGVRGFDIWGPHKHVKVEMEVKSAGKFPVDSSLCMASFASRGVISLLGRKSRKNFWGHRLALLLGDSGSVVVSVPGARFTVVVAECCACDADLELGFPAHWQSVLMYGGILLDTVQYLTPFRCSPRRRILYAAPQVRKACRRHGIQGLWCYR